MPYEHHLVDCSNNLSVCRQKSELSLITIHVSGCCFFLTLIFHKVVYSDDLYLNNLRRSGIVL